MRSSLYGINTEYHIGQFADLGKICIDKIIAINYNSIIMLYSGRNNTHMRFSDDKKGF